MLALRVQSYKNQADSIRQQLRDSGLFVRDAAEVDQSMSEALLERMRAVRSARTSSTGPEAFSDENPAGC